MIISLFAPFCLEEFTRVLKDGGIIIRAVPLEKHLLALKAAVYDTVYENKLESIDCEGFRLLERRDVRGRIHLDSHEDINSVFSMTPYYYKTGAKDKEKLEKLAQLDTEIEFGLFVYKKISSR